MPLLWKLFLSYLWVIVLALVLVTYASTELLEDTYLNQMQESLEARAWMLESRVRPMLDDPAAVDALTKTLGERISTRLTVMTGEAYIMGDTEKQPEQMENHATPDRPEVLAAMAGRVGHATRYSTTLQADLMYVAVPLYQGEELAAILRASVPVATLAKNIAAIQRQILLTGAAATVLLAGVSLFLARRLAGPLREMKQGAECLARGELHHRLGGAGTPEIDALAYALNDMAAQLDQRIKAMARQQNELEAVLSSMTEGVLAVDTDGRIISINRAGRHMLGIADGDQRGRMIHEVVRKAEFLQFVDATLQASTPTKGDIEIYTETYDTRFLKVYGAPLVDTQQRPIGGLLVFQDTTRLQRLETVRRDFVANVSHELRTPITSIKGFVETVLDDALEDRAAAERFLRIALKHVDRLNAIIDDLLTLSRVEKTSEEGAVELQPHPLASVLRSAAELCEAKAAQRQIEIQVTCPEDLQARLNETLFEQALVNLLDNAMKYSEPGSAVSLTAAQNEERVRVAVRDQGCGIEARHLSRLFERFYRADKARSRELGGTGLGLAIVRHITLAHHGSVDIQSTPGRGTEVVIELPAFGANGAV